MSGVKNAPTCYRAPRWPDPEFPRKIPKKYPSGRSSGTPRKYPKKYRKNTKNAHFWYSAGYFLVFSGYFWGKFWESIISARGVVFRYFSWKFRGRAISGLCSRSGRSQVRSGKRPKRKFSGLVSRGHPGLIRADVLVQKLQAIPIETLENQVFDYVFFLPPLFCQSIPVFWTQNLGKCRLISANLS